MGHSFTFRSSPLRYFKGLQIKKKSSYHFVETCAAEAYSFGYA